MPTRMAKLTLRYPGKVKILFDSRRLMAVGPKKKISDNFRSYMGFLGRKQPSILYKNWKNVPANTKELIWQAILEKFEIFFAKRLRAQKIQSHNTCPQRTSRGGYEVLTQKIIDEKLKARKEAADDPSQIIPPPSPPSRHETWKRARITKSGDYINEETSSIAAKIDALEQEQSSGNFKPSGRSDILAVAIGKPDHPSRVRGVGTGYTVRTYFGKQERAADGMVSRDEVAAIVAEMQAKLRAEMQMILSSQSTSAAEPHTPVVLSAKGSCAVERGESDKHNVEDGDDIGDYELYVEDPHKRLVAYGLIHDLGSNLHNMKMKNDEVRVSVERVVVADAPIPFPTEEVNKVGEALKQFIAWPRRLVVENIKQKGVSQRELFPSPVVKDTEKDVLKVLWIEAADITKPKNCCIEAGIVSLTRAYVSINQMDIMGLLAAGTVSVPVMKFYNKCLYNVLVSSGRADKYGLMCPLAIQSHGNNEEMGLIRNRIGEGGFDCFLLPFYDKGWELMALCPKSGCIASFCCQGKGKKHKKKFTDMIDTAIETYQVVKGMRSNTLSKPKWVYPKCCNKDAVDPECGLFVMRHMLELIKLDIVNSFEQVLHMDKPYSSDDIADVRRSWAKCFLDDIR
ncbi:Proteasome subunit beta type-3 [Castilleja foliolosa]|uniref:Proteasome subunit beta type-3 n=1 Tax=Castilleja foliolosa TaxID=1961234 RepID=A0ABD3D6W0_9LAMI